MLSIQLNGWQFVLSVVSLSAILLFFIVVIRKYLNRNWGKSMTNNKNSSLKNRTKNPAAEVGQFRGIFFRLGLLIALALVFFAFSWTSFDKVGVNAFDSDYQAEILEEEIPITFHKEKPKPKMKEIRVEVLDDDLLIDEDPELTPLDVFEDTEIFEEAIDLAEKTEDAPLLPLPEAEEEYKDFIRIAEVMPRFPGCEDLNASTKEKEKCAQKKLLQYIYDKLKYPAIARETNVQGTVVVQFVVSESGYIEDIKIVRDIGGGCGDAAAKVVANMNDLRERWYAGRQRGRPVRVLYTLPVKFKLEG